VLKYSRIGLVLRAVGENHDAAHALGYKVQRIRLAAILFGGAMAGLGGAYISLIRVPQWTDGITAGAGWIALAIVVFASWKPWRVLIGAYLFGGISALQLNSQAAGGLPLSLMGLLLVIAICIDTIVQIFGRRSAPDPLRIGIWGFGVLCVVAVWLWGSEIKLDIPVEYLSMSPYLITILVLVIMSSGKGRASLNAPAALGQNFHASR
jgi:general nucleoside transport system permease protein